MKKPGILLAILLTLGPIAIFAQKAATTGRPANVQWRDIYTEKTYGSQQHPSTELLGKSY